MQPLGGKKSCKVLGQQNHATSQDKQKSRNLSGQTKMQPVRTKKIKQPLGTKKIMQPPETKKNHVTSWEKKIRPSFWTKKNLATS